MSEHVQLDWLSRAHQVLDIEIEGLRAVRDHLDETFLRALECLAACSGRIVVCGLGKSGLVGRKIAATLSSTGSPAFFLHPVEGAHGDLGMIRNDDVVLAISNSGETDELNAILPSLKTLAGSLIGLTGGVHSTMASLCDVVINSAVPQEACPLGVAPTASTTATLALGDALAVCLLQWKQFALEDFHRFHPGGALGQRLSLPVQALMRATALPVVQHCASLEDALVQLDKGGLGCVCICDMHGVLLGIITDGDIRRLLCAGPVERSVSASAVMTANPCVARQQESAAKVLERMEAKAITVLPVTDDQGILCGMVHMHDVLGQGKVRFSHD